MTVAQLAKRLNISPKTAARLVRQPGFPAIMVQKRWVIDEKAFDRWYDRHSGTVVLEPEKQQHYSGRKQVWNLGLLDWNYPKRKEATT